MMEILTIILAITTVLFIKLWYSTSKRAEKALKEMQAQLISTQFELNKIQNWESRYKELDHAYKIQTEQLKSAWDTICDHRKVIYSYLSKEEPKTDLEKQAEWASANVVAKKPEPKKQTASKPKKKTSSDSTYSSTSTSSSEPYNDYDTSRNLSDFSSSSSDYSSSSSDSYSGGGGDFGGGGAGGDW